MAVFPFPQLAELREKYTYNITPFPTSVRSNGRFVQARELRRGFSGANAKGSCGASVFSAGARAAGRATTMLTWMMKMPW